MSSAGSPMARGFTLLELLVVLAVMGLIAALVVPRFAQGRPGIELERAARGLVADLRAARVQAIASNRAVALVLDPERPGYRIGARRHALPEAAALSLDPPVERRIGFYPDGSSDGGRLTLRLGARSRTVRVDWLLGRVELAEPSDDR